MRNPRPTRPATTNEDAPRKPGSGGDGSFEADLIHDDVPVLDLPLHSRITLRESAEGRFPADLLDHIYGPDTNPGAAPA